MNTKHAASEPDYKQLYFALLARLKADRAEEWEVNRKAWGLESDADQAAYQAQIDKCDTDEDYANAKHAYDLQRKQTLEKYGYDTSHIA